MKIEIQVEGEAPERIRQKMGAELTSARSQLVREAAIQALERILLLNPVETARSRAAWAGMLEELGGTPPSGWEGPHPTAIAEGRQLGHSVQNEIASQSEVRLVNGVSYVPHLEYGTSRMSPFAMVRQGLRQVSGSLGELFRWSE